MAVASCCKYFEEDIVYRINRKGNLVFGLVLENSEFKGHVRVAWHPKGEEEVLSEKKVYLADRSLMPSDVVRRVVKGKDTQRGYCRNVDVIASCQILGTRQVLYNINSKDLTPLEEFSVDIAVYMDSWVGMVKAVKSKIYLRCFDGSKCCLNSDDASDLDDVQDKRDRGSEFKKYDFYPGQVLWGPIPTVESVKVVSLGVNWQCRAYTKDSNISCGDLQQPKYNVTDEDLKKVKMLNVYEPCTLQIGDRNYYTVKDSDIIFTKEDWRRMQRESLFNTNSLNEHKLRNGQILMKSKEVTTLKEENRCSTPLNDLIEKENCNDSEFDDIDEDSNISDAASISSQSSVSSIKKVKNRPTLVTKVLKNKKLKRARRRITLDVISIKAGDLVVVEALSTASEVEVVWQDGSVENNVSSTSLYPIHHLDDQEFFPGDFVVENRDFLNPHDYGVIRKVDHNGRTALVQWLKTYTQGANPRPIFLNEEEVSVYDLKDHSDFKYRPGSVVIRVANFENDDSEYTAGQVLDVHPNGMVEVSWVNSQRSFCYPQDLYKVGEYDSDEGELWDDDGDSDDSWETESTLSTVEEESGGENVDDKALRPKVAANIEKARASMARLEEIFTQNPSLQNSTSMKHLIQVYKDCKYLDRLMGTNFFHESHFQGLLERVRERGRRKCAQRVAEQVTRLFQSSSDRISTSIEPEVEEKLCDLNGQLNSSSSTNLLCNGHDETISNCNSQELENATSTSSSTIDDGGQLSNMCVKLCSLLKIQLLKAHEDVMKRFGQTNMENSPTSVPESPKKLENSTESNTVTEMNVECTPVPSVTGTFTMLDSVPDGHKLKLSIFQPTDTSNFYKAIKLLKTSLPDGIIFKGFEDRMDLYSVMIKGPQRTPYEDGLFFFDLQLSNDYPKSPPVCYYISYCSDRLNPNLYEDGKVCVSLLGTWGGKGTEVWTCTSNLLQLMVSIQGLILVSEPYFNEAGYERQKGTQQGRENSRMYNEMVILKLVYSMTKTLLYPPDIFKEEIIEHYKSKAFSFIHRLEKWLEVSEAYNGMHPTTPTTPTAFLNAHGEALSKEKDLSLPEFPLIPASKGFCITLRKALSTFRQMLFESFGIIES
ncbi:hypothetical protein CHUAL_007964 [Chamberlinius hualienensis]